MSDVEPEAPEPEKEGGLKSPAAQPADASDEHTGQSDLKEERREGDEDGGMLNEG